MQVDRMPFSSLKCKYNLRKKFFLVRKKLVAKMQRAENSGGELGIRTPDGLGAHTRLAGEHLRPLGQLSKMGA